MSIGKNGEKKASGKKPHMKNTYKRTKIIFMKSSAMYSIHICKTVCELIMKNDNSVGHSSDASHLHLGNTRLQWVLT